AAPDPGGEDHQASEGADHQGVDEGAEHAHQTLLYRVVGPGGGMGDGGAAQAGLVGEDAAGKAPANGQQHGGAGEATLGGGGGEGGFEHQRNGPGNGRAVDGEHGEGG